MELTLLCGAQAKAKEPTQVTSQRAGRALESIASDGREGAVSEKLGVREQRPEQSEENCGKAQEELSV